MNSKIFVEGSPQGVPTKNYIERVRPLYGTTLRVSYEIHDAAARRNHG
jgi:hypothetical protein